MNILKNNSKGMTLIELMLVVVILGVILGAVFLLLTKGTEELHFARRQNELDISGRQVIEALTNSIIWAGYMPNPYWDDDEWHPITLAAGNELEFYADYYYTGELGILEDSDYRRIKLLASGNVQITDRTAAFDQRVGNNVTNLTFTYLDEDGVTIDSTSTEEARDQIRHIQIRVELSSEYAGNSYQAVLYTTITPRNLGLSHDIDPSFGGWPEIKGNIAFNAADSVGVLKPTINEIQMVNRLSFWGYTVSLLTDADLEVYDYSNTNLLILRHMDSGIHSTSTATFLETLQIPIITMNAEEASDTFIMGDDFIDVTGTEMRVIEDTHPVNASLPDTTIFSVYTEPGEHSVLYNFDAGTTFLTKANDGDDYSGVCFQQSGDESTLRVHYSPWEASKFTHHGWLLFSNTVEWGTWYPEQDIGEPITVIEDFEATEENFPDLIITSIEFEATSCSLFNDTYTYDDIDVYMSTTSDSVFNADGEWDKGTMELVAEDLEWTATWEADGSCWNRIDLDNPFVLPAGTNLMVKIEKYDADIQDLLKWGCINTGTDYQSRRARSHTADPNNLARNSNLPVIRLNTAIHGTLEMIDKTANRKQVPVNTLFEYSDFEAIYTPELFPINEWVHGGRGDDWQFGEPVFVPDIDPALTTENGDRIAGTDLGIVDPPQTYDGYYEDDAYSWLVSPAYEMPATGTYNRFTLRFYRCIRLATGDNGFLWLGFSDTETPPDSLSADWQIIRTYIENQDSWANENIDVTLEFNDYSTSSYFFIRFGLSSNLSFVRGGWNIDNIQVFGDNI